jgi:hypothetical protein
MMKRLLIFLLLALPLPVAAQPGYIAGTLNTTANVTSLANEGTTGTLQYGLVKYTGAPTTAIRTAVTDTSGAVGVCTASTSASSICGTTGNATVQTSGDVNCVFDNATVAGDLVVISSTTAGDCHDQGTMAAATAMFPIQVVGIVKSTNGSPGTYIMTLFPQFQLQDGALINVTSVAVNGAVSTDQNLMTLAIPAQGLNTVGKTIRVLGYGTYTTGASGAGTMTFKIKACTVSGCGSGTVVTLQTYGPTAAQTASATNMPWNVKMDCSTVTTGATGTIMCNGWMNTTLGTTATAAGAPYLAQITGTATVDLTVAENFQVTIADSGASANDSFTQRHMIIDNRN